MNKTNLGAIEILIDEIIEERVQQKMKQFFDNIKRDYPSLPYDLGKATVGITKSSFDTLMAPENLGNSSRSYVSKFEDPIFVQQGLGLKEPAKFQMTQEDYENGKKYSNIPVSGFDGLTAYETNFDRNFFNKDTSVATREEIDQIPEFIKGYNLNEEVEVEIETEQEFQAKLKALELEIENSSPEELFNLLPNNQVTEHHDSVMKSVINLSKG